MDRQWPPAWRLHTDIGLLLGILQGHIDMVEEGLGGEDATIVASIEADYEARKDLPRGDTRTEALVEALGKLTAFVGNMSFHPVAEDDHASALVEEARAALSLYRKKESPDGN